MVKIERRYQYRSRDGIEWTTWFKHSLYETMEDAEKAIKNLRKVKEADKRLLGEYRII